MTNSIQTEVRELNGPGNFLVERCIDDPKRNFSKKKSKSTLNKVKEKDWGQLSQSDLRKVYSSKSGTMYEALKENGHIYPIKKFLAG